MGVFNVFLSYRREDGTETAKMLNEFLVEQGLKVFFDTNALVDGHRFDTQIKTALQAAPHYILIGSEKAFQFREGEDWVRKELTLALKYYKADKKKRTVTVLLPAGTEIPNEQDLPKNLRKIVKFQMISVTEKDALKRVLNAVTAVSHANLWHASYRWLEQQKQSGGRFCESRVDEDLLPCAAEQLPMQVSCGMSGGRDLLKAIREETSHVYLIGQGGIGKTTALLKIMNDAYEGRVYDETAVVPIFVELSAAPETFGRLYQGGNSSFIRRSIYRQVRTDKSTKQVSMAAVEELDNVFTQPYAAVVEPVDKLLTNKTPMPQYLLLLDGLNEISRVMIEQTKMTVAQMVIEEIRYLLRACPNVRVVLTSRSDEQALQEEKIVNLELAGVSDQVIDHYLEQRQGTCKLKPEMREILRIPLFLIMYAELSAADDLCTQGEILHRFFSGKRMQGYTVQSRLEDVDQSVRQSASAVAQNRIDPQMLRFLLDFVLPEIGWYMVRQEKIRISGRQLRKVITQVLYDREDTDICGEFGADAFRVAASVSVDTVAKKLNDRLGGNPWEVGENVVELLTYTLGVLKYTDNSYHFTHQHIRDYFAARKGINTLKLATAMDQEDEQQLAWQCLEEVFGQRALDLVVHRFIGEILREHRNIPVEKRDGHVLPSLTEEQRLLTDALDIYRNRYPGGRGVAELVGILVDVRKNLAGCDFSGLDLSGCNFSGATLCMGRLCAKFERALVKGEAFLHTGHTSYINTVSNCDGRYFITGGDDGKVLGHQAETGLCALLKKAEGPVWFAQILADGSLLTVRENRRRHMYFSACEKIVVERTNLQSGETEQQLELPNESLDVRMSTDEKILLIRQCGMLQVIDATSLQVLQRYSFSQENMISEFLGDSYQVLLSDGSTIHALTGEKGQLLPARSEERYIWRAAVYGNTLCTMNREEELLRLEGYGLRDKKRLFSFTQSWRNEDRWALHAPMHNKSKYYNLHFSDSGKWLALITPNDVFVYETNGWKLQQCFPGIRGQYINDVAFDDGNGLMALGTLDGMLCLCETEGFTLRRCTAGVQSRVHDMGISGEHLITYSADGVLRCWNLQTASLTAARRFAHGPLTGAALTKTGDLVLVNDTYYTIPRLQPKTEQQPAGGYSQVDEGVGWHHPIHIYKDGDRLYTVHGQRAWICDPYLFVSGQFEGRDFVSCCELTSGQRLWSDSRMACFKLEKASSCYLITREKDGLVVYDSTTGDELGRMEQEERFVAFGQLHGDYYLSYDGYGEEKHTKIFRLPEGALVDRVQGRVSFSDDGKWAQVERKVTYDQHQLEVYDVRSRACLLSLRLPAVENPLLSGVDISYTQVKKNQFAVCGSEDVVCVYQLTEVPHLCCKLIGEYTMEPGLDIIGLDLSVLHPDSNITPTQEKTLRAYGAIL